MSNAPQKCNWYLNWLFKRIQSMFIFCEINKIIWLMQAVVQSCAIKIILSNNDSICMCIFTSLHLGNTDSRAVPVTVLPKLISCLSSFITRNIDVVCDLSLQCVTTENWYGETLIDRNFNVPVIHERIIRQIKVKKSDRYSKWYADIRSCDITKEQPRLCCLQSTCLLRH